MPRPPAIIGPRDLVTTGRRDMVESEPLPADYVDTGYWKPDPKLAPDHYDVPPRQPYESVDDYRKRLWAEKERLRQIDESLQAEQNRLGPYNEAIADELTRLRQAMNSASHAQMCIRNTLDMLPRPAPLPTTQPKKYRKPLFERILDGVMDFFDFNPIGSILEIVLPFAVLGVACYFGLPPLKAWLNGPEPEFSTTGSHTLTMRADYRGIYVTNCKLGNANFNCFFDTGASAGDIIMLLDEATARRAGVGTTQLNFNHSIETVSGSTKTAYTRVRNLQIGPFVVDNAEILISKAEQSPASVATGFTSHYKISIANSTMTITE